MTGKASQLHPLHLNLVLVGLAQGTMPLLIRSVAVVLGSVPVLTTDRSAT